MARPGPGSERVSGSSETDLSRGIEGLQALLSDLRAGASETTAEVVLESLAELDVAHEELRVADEELRAQREQIDELLRRNADEQSWRARIGTMLPVALVVTDSHGVIEEANAAAGLLLRANLAHLLGKPLPTYVAHEDRRTLRAAISRLVDGAPEQRLTVCLQPRSERPVPVGAVGFVDPPLPDARTRIRWVFVPSAGEPDTDTAPPEVGRREAATAAAFAEMCRLPHQIGDRQALLSRMASLAAAAVPGASAVSVVLGPAADPEAVASDSTLAQSADWLQMDSGEGPVFDAGRTRSRVLSSRVGDDERWLRLAERARQGGLGSILAVPVRLGSEMLGVLNVYSVEEDAFDDYAVDVGELMASAVAAVLQEVRDRSSLKALATQLERALQSRAVIDQAKGIMMARHGGSPDEAFQRLAALSKRYNVKLREVARVVVAEAGTARD